MGAPSMRAKAMSSPCGIGHSNYNGLCICAAFSTMEVNNFLRVRIIDDGTLLVGSKIRREESETLIFVIERIGKQ
jgi:hypothetical protein